MAVKIRLARSGSKKKPYYKVVVANATSPRDGKFIEIIGTFNPMLPKDSSDRFTINAEKAQHWLSTGALPTEKTAKLLSNAGVSLPASVNKRLEQVKNNPKRPARKEAKA